MSKLGLQFPDETRAVEIAANPTSREIEEQLRDARRVDETLMIEEKLPDFVIGLHEVTDPETGETIYVNGKGRRQTLDGREIPDPAPMDPPIGYKKQPSMFEQMRELIRSEKLRQAAEEAGVETFEEGDDFEVGDDYDPRSPYEHNFDPAPPPIPSAASAGAPGAAAPEGVNPTPAASPSPPASSAAPKTP